MNKPLHWSAPILFLVGLFGVVLGASGKWPQLMPWGSAFWFGWTACYIFKWMIQQIAPTQREET